MFHLPIFLLIFFYLFANIFPKRCCSANFAPNWALEAKVDSLWICRSDPLVLLCMCSLFFFFASLSSSSLLSASLSFFSFFSALSFSPFSLLGLLYCCLYRTRFFKTRFPSLKSSIVHLRCYLSNIYIYIFFFFFQLTKLLVKSG